MTLVHFQLAANLLQITKIGLMYNDPLHNLTISDTLLSRLAYLNSKDMKDNPILRITAHGRTGKLELEPHQGELIPSVSLHLVYHSQTRSFQKGE
jgi:hypothetical protein